MNYALTVHARESLTKRKNIRLDWLERVIECPQLIQPIRWIPNWSIA